MADGQPEDEPKAFSLASIAALASAAQARQKEREQKEEKAREAQEARLAAREARQAQEAWAWSSWPAWDPWAAMGPWMMMGGYKGKGKGKGGGGRGLNDFPADRKVWIGELSESISSKDLKAHIQAITVVNPVCVEVFGNGSGGAAFENREDIETAISELNGSLLTDSFIKVDVWTSREKQGEGGKGKKRKSDDGWSGGSLDWLWGGWGFGDDPWDDSWESSGGKGSKSSKGDKGDKGAAGFKRHKRDQVDDSGGELGEFEGKIKSFNDTMGWGFIECKEIMDAYERDVFLHMNEKKGFRVGYNVKFLCVLNKDGKPQAKDLQPGAKIEVPERKPKAPPARPLPVGKGKPVGKQQLPGKGAPLLVGRQL